ncbi:MULTISPECIES: type IV pilin protein [Pseudoalteromonas]|uniref:Prepilin-type N-terminal cleavage/methylation domain-containing protein n=1 Tax=Pseudoalteromonas amylolytica TaxID=1859457 RepID=A0A1S1MRJ8_9GAMM|nr:MULTISPECIES: type IV pilin protein [Pseudoalteromonas]OHU86755.1 prepilin-type N-terminal cleavage/methylation domain-containing protein [Pseudoalteromonas sp. JW3]OHU88720.1 prepilin-type N-terminal cleavage/methylation domain-containing protein [Pseudoalteromonas amylolytica]
MMKSNNRMDGFTLLEALIVLVILGIVLSIAYPSYQTHLMKAARAEAMVLLLDAANRQEQYFIDNRVYTSTLSDIGVPEKTENGYYSLSVTVNDDEFEVKAKPIAGPVKDDQQCTELTINELGQKLSSGSGTNELCWNQQ